MAIVYIATNRVNGKRYVGVSCKRLRWRRAQHEYEAMKGKSHCRRFHNAMRKYGPDAFDWVEVFSTDNYDEALAEEIRLIARLHPEYNLTAGGEGVPGLVHSAETRAKNSAAHRGKKHTAEHRQKISDGMRGATRSPDVGNNISAAKKGKKLSPAHRRALSEAKRGKPMTAKQRATFKTSFVAGMKMDPEIVRRRVATRLRNKEVAHVDAMAG